MLVWVEAKASGEGPMPKSATQFALHNVRLGYADYDPRRPYFVCETCDGARMERAPGMSEKDWERNRDSFAAEHPCPVQGRTA